MQMCSIGELAQVLGVAVVTLRRWHKAGRLVPACRTCGGHRRYEVLGALRQLGLSTESTGKRTIAYARVSSHDQAEQLQIQALRLERHCAARGYAGVDVITDPGSGKNLKAVALTAL